MAGSAEHSAAHRAALVPRPFRAERRAGPGRGRGMEGLALCDAPGAACAPCGAGDHTTNGRWEGAVEVQRITALTRRGAGREGTANFLVNRRMAKSQQMRWSRRGADRLLQVRCAVYNGTLGTGFGQRFHAASDALPQVAAAV